MTPMGNAVVPHQCSTIHTLLPRFCVCCPCTAPALQPRTATRSTSTATTSVPGTAWARPTSCSRCRCTRCTTTAGTRSTEAIARTHASALLGHCRAQQATSRGDVSDLAAAGGGPCVWRAISPRPAVAHPFPYVSVAFLSIPPHAADLRLSAATCACRAAALRPTDPRMWIALAQCYCHEQVRTALPLPCLWVGRLGACACGRGRGPDSHLLCMFGQRAKG